MSTSMCVFPKDLKLFQCGFCHMAFDVNADLVVHVKAHLQTKPFQCGYCKISYFTNVELTMHLEAHKVFVCVPQENVSSAHIDIDCNQESGVHAEQCHSAAVDAEKEKSSADHPIMIKNDMQNFAQPLLQIPRQDTIHDNASRRQESNENTHLESTVKTQSEIFHCKPHKTSNNLTDNVHGSLEMTTEDGNDCDYDDAESMSVFTHQVSSTEIECDHAAVKEEKNGVNNCEIVKKMTGKEKQKMCLFGFQMNDTHSTSTSNKTEGVLPLSASSDSSGQGHAKFVDGKEKELPKFFVCSLCGESFRDPKDVGHHFRSVHKKKKNNSIRIKSSVDKATVNQTCNADSQIQIQDNLIYSVCHVCKQVFKFRFELAHHILTVHNENSLRVFECGLCGHRFKLQHHLKDHFNARHGKGGRRFHTPQLNGSPTNLLPETAASEVLSHTCMETGATFSNKADITTSATDVLDIGGNFCCDVDGSSKTFLANKSDNVSAHAFSLNTKNLKQTIVKQSKLHKTDITVFGEDKIGNHESNVTETDIKSGKKLITNMRISSTVCANLDDSVLSPLKTRDSRLMDPFGSDQGSKFVVKGQDSLLKPFLCSLCGEMFDDAKLVRRHFTRVHLKCKDKTIPLPPDSSRKQVTRASGNSDQFQLVNYSSCFQCDYCKQAYRSRGELSHHLLTDHQEKDLRVYECGVCHKKFKFSHHLKDHYDSIHGEGSFKPHKCNECGAGFKRPLYLKHHLASAHGKPAEKSYQCPICEKKFNWKHHMKTHIRSLHPSGDIVEGVASSQKRSPMDVKSGQLSTRTNNMRKPKQKSCMCHLCGKSLRDLTTLKTHIRDLHTDNRPFQCEMCPKAYKCKTSLEVHIKTHTKEKPFICEICGRGFATYCTLKCHRHTHTNARPYKCELCYKGFNAYSGLRNHRLVHRKDKRHTCEECGMKFYSSDLLKRHAVTHTDLRPEVCKKCNKTYRSSSSLRYHMIHSHPNPV